MVKVWEGFNFSSNGSIFFLSLAADCSAYFLKQILEPLEKGHMHRNPQLFAVLQNVEQFTALQKD